MSIRVKRVLRGLAKSWSANMSMIAVLLGGLEQYRGVISSLIGPDNTGFFLMGAGLLGIYLRFRTTESLEMKGMK